MIVFAFSFLSVNAQTNKKTEIKRIDFYVKTVNKFVKNKKPQLIFGDTAETADSEENKNWQRFDSEEDLEKTEAETPLYTTAHNWLKNGKIIRSNFYFTSPSGDWAHFVNHYFRADGSLAFIESEARTFYGELIILKTRYFDRKGRLLKKTIRYKDLFTKKPIKPKKEYLETVDSLVSGENYFKKTSQLPFADLVRKKQ